MDKLKEPYQNNQFFKDWLEGRRESEIVLISVENLNWLVKSIDELKDANKNNSLIKKLKHKDKVIEELKKHNEALIIENLTLKSR